MVRTIAMLEQPDVVLQQVQATRPHTTRDKPLPTVEDTVSKLRISYPFLRAAKVDYLLRQLVLAHMINMNHSEGEGIFLPNGMPVEYLTEEEFRIARDSLAGVVPAHLRGKISDVISGLKGRMDAAVRRFRDGQGASGS